MKSQRHIIDKISVDIDTMDEREAFRLKDNLANFLKEEVLPEVERLFDRHCKRDQIRRFQHIEIQLSFKDTSDMNLLRDRIVARLASKMEVADSIDFGETRRETDVHARMATRSAGTNGQQQSIDVIANTQAVFFYFLKNGTLPWHAQKETLDFMFVTKQWYSQLDKKAFLSELRATLQRGGNAMERLIFQVPSANILAMIDKLNVIKFSDIRAFKNFLETIPPVQRYQWFRLILKTSVFETKREWIEEWFKIIELYLPVGKLDEKEVMRQVQAIREKTKSYFTKATSDTCFDLTANEKEEFLMWLSSHQPDEPAERGLTQKVLPIENDPTIISDGSNVDLEKEPLFFGTDAGDIAVRNAGQVLFFPFISTLFRQLKWLDKSQKIKPEHQLRAIQILHYCATGNESFFEAEMIIEKFLCGVPLNTTVPSYSLLTKGMKLRADKMLQELIQNWPALKNTSPDGLRQLFVQRNGKLTQRDQGLKIIIERKAQDVLLEKLPWGISIVKLPWMKELLFVEW